MAASSSSSNRHKRNGSAPHPAPRAAPRASSSEPDVFLSVPDVHVDKIQLDVERLDAHLSLEVRLADLLDLRAGVDVSIDKVELDIEGVGAEALLEVRLENVYAILDRALSTIDGNPQIVDKTPP